MNHLEDEGFYGVNCINCGKPICLKRWKGIVSDAELPNSHCYDAHIPCPYCNERCVYTEDRLVYYQRLTTRP